MTPMIDVIFLLLTFFVLTARFEKPEQSLPLAFGTAAAASTQPSVPLELSITPAEGGCAVVVNGTQRIVIAAAAPAAGLAALAEDVRSQLAAAHSQVPVKLHCDDAASWDIVSKVYDVLYGMGARNITFVINELKQ